MSEEKQIEELLNQLIRTNGLGTLNEVANHLYSEGYRKQIDGEWVDQYQGKYDNKLYKCSMCGETAFHDEKRWLLTHYCPNCGAKMKGGE